MRDLSYKKYKCIIGVGCSYTCGSFEGANPNRSNCINPSTYTDDNVPRTSYVEELGNLIGVESINLAKNGFSFKFLAFYTYLWITHNRDKVQDALLLVGLTHRRRETFWNTNYNGKKKFPGTTKTFTPPFVLPTKYIMNHTEKRAKWFDEMARELNTTPKEFHSFLKILWTSLDDPNQRDILDEMYMVLLQSYCNSIGLDILFIDIPNEAVHFPSDNFTDWRELVGPVFKWPNDRHGWKDYLTSIDDSYRWEHPNYNDHVHLAQLLYDYIESNKDVL